MLLSTSFAAALLYWWTDRGPRRAGLLPTAQSAEAFAWRDLLHFGRAYWYLLALCVLWYSVILAFRSTFSIKYFQHTHGLDLAAAGEMAATLTHELHHPLTALSAYAGACEQLLERGESLSGRTDAATDFAQF